LVDFAASSLNIGDYRQYGLFGKLKLARLVVAGLVGSERLRS
jgi:hypothetical protein